MRNVHVVGGRGEILQLLLGEDVDRDQMDLGVTVLSGLGGGHLDNLARAVLDTHKPVLPQGGTLLRVGGRGTSIGALKGDLMLQVEMKMLVSLFFSKSLLRSLRDFSQV